MAVNFLPGSPKLTLQQTRERVKICSEDVETTDFLRADTKGKKKCLEKMIVTSGSFGTSKYYNTLRLAAKLFLELPRYQMGDFLMHMCATPKNVQNFRDAMLANTIIHSEIEQAEPGITGMTRQQRSLERSYAKRLDAALSR